MLSLGSMSQNSGQYYLELARGDYYYQGGEPPGRWLGTGAARLGLSGEVAESPFYYLLDGLAPDGSEPLVRMDNGKAHHPGWDLTFSAPKSVSVIWSQADQELRQAIQECQFQAVSKAVEYLEQEVAVTRRGKGGVVREHADIVASLFEHGTSRAGDPQLHTHALFLNVCVRQDGTYGTLAGQEFYRHKMTAGAIYRAELACLLRQRLGLVAKPHGHCFELKGVPEKVIRFFSKRRQQVEEALQSQGLHSARAAAFAALGTRQVKEHVARGELLQGWQAIGAQLGFGPAQAAALRREPGRIVDSEALADQAADRALVTAMEGQSYFTERALLRFTAEECQWLGLGAEAAREAVRRRLQGHDLVAIGEVQHEPVFSTLAMLRLEEELLAIAEETRNSADHLVAPELVERALRRHAELAEEQQDALRHITGQSGDVKLVNGLAGTGKTHLLTVARGIWEKAGYGVVGAAAAGKAAEGLQQGSGIDSQTVASLRYARDPEYAKWLRSQDPQSLTAVLKGPLRSPQPSPVKLDRKTILVVDEASMISTDDLAWLMREARRTGTKLVLVGDDKQLPAIAAGGGFLGLARLLGAARLVKIQRQQEEWAQEAVRLMAEGEVEQALRAYHEHGLVTVSGDRQKAMDELLKCWSEQGLLRPQQHVIFAATNQEVRYLNQAAQEARRAAGRLGVLKVRVNGYDLRANDRVMFTKNSRTFGVANGMTGTVLLVEPLSGNVVVRLGGGRVVAIPLWRYDSLVLGYAMTTHKGQGMTVDNSYLLMGGMMQDRELAYVQLSRARYDTRLFISEQEAGENHQDLVKQLKQSHAKELATNVAEQTRTQTAERGYARSR